MDAWVQKMMSDPNWQALIRLVSDKQLAIRILRKQKEKFMHQSSLQKYQKGYDPADKNGLVDFVGVYEQLDREVMEELGLDKHVKDWTNFKIMKLIVPIYMGDPEVFAELDYMVQIGNPMMAPDIGSVCPDACVLSGSLTKLFSDFQDRVNFLCVYLAEAHPKGMWNFGPRYCYMGQHKTIDDRIKAARDMIALDTVYNTFTTDLSDNTKVRLVLDTMDNTFAMSYSAHPDRVIIIDSEDKVAYIGGHIAMQLDQPRMLMTDEVRYWLQRHMPSSRL